MIPWMNARIERAELPTVPNGSRDSRSIQKLDYPRISAFDRDAGSSGNTPSLAPEGAGEGRGGGESRSAKRISPIPAFPRKRRKEP